MKRVLSFACVLVVALLVAAVPQAAERAPQGALTTTLEVGQWWHELSDPIAMRLTITNQSAQDVHLLRWETPVDGITADIFAVERDGVPVSYTGMLVKRPAPTAEDYLTLAPGASVTAEFDLSSVYTMSVRGQYTARYRVPLEQNLVAESAGRDLTAAAPAAVESNSVQLWIEGRDEADVASFERELATVTMGKGGNGHGHGGGGGGGGGGTTQFISCDNTQQSTLLTALSNAGMISGKALAYLDHGSDTDGLYATWFDTYGRVNNGWNTADSHFTAITNALTTKPFTFDCSCHQRYYAYVYPNDPYTVYLCKVFWTAPNLGTDSKAGTLVHETSHFNVVASTNDWVYGTSGAMNLAQTDPTKALDNADNHEYFAEHQK